MNLSVGVFLSVLDLNSSISRHMEQIIYMYLKDTPSVPNYKSFQKSWRVKVFSSLTKNIERNIKIYVIKWVHYENITNKKSNDTWLVPKMLLFCYINLVKLKKL